MGMVLMTEPLHNDQARFAVRLWSSLKIGGTWTLPSVGVYKRVGEKTLALTEIHAGELRAFLRVRAQPRVSDEVRAPPSFERGPCGKECAPRVAHLLARRQQRARLPQHAKVRDRAPHERDRKKDAHEGRRRLCLLSGRRGGVRGLLRGRGGYVVHEFHGRKQALEREEWVVVHALTLT